MARRAKRLRNVCFGQGQATAGLGRQAPHPDRSPWANQPRRWCQDSLQQPAESDPAGDDAQFVAKMVAGGLRRVADGRLSTPSRRSSWWIFCFASEPVNEVFTP